MKKMKKLITLVLALVMVMSLATTAMAATVSNATTHAYKAYQIFSGTQADGKPQLGDVEWGEDINASTFLTALQADKRFEVEGTNIFAACTDAAAVATALAKNPGETIAKAFANVADKNLKSSATGTSIAADADSVELDAGYYLLVDVTDVNGQNDASNSALLQLTNKDTVEISKKYDVPSSDKEITAVTHIQSRTDFTNTDAVDAEIGDTVEFTLNGTLPSNFTDYESYAYTFHDTLSAGMTYKGDAKVYVDGKQVTTGVTVTTNACTKTGCNCNLQIAIADLTKIEGVTQSSKIKAVYSATLDSDAVMGSTGNPNEMYVEFSNNPNHGGDGNPSTGDTPKDTVLVFTYQLDVTKVDGANKNTKLENAEFVLLNSDATKVATVDEDGKLTGWEALPGEGENWNTSSVLTSGADGKFIVKGLDSGTYKLRETKAPASYNLLTEDISLVITGTITGEALTDLKINVKGSEEAGDITSGIVNATVENNQGNTLPETGGMGTTLFYVFGAVMVMGAAVLLVTKKRMAR